MTRSRRLTSLPRLITGMLSLGLLPMLVSCDHDDGSEVTATPPSTVVLNTPDEFINTRAVDVNNLRLEVALDGRTRSVERASDGRWVTRFGLPSSGTVEIVATWFETVTETINDMEAFNLAREVPLVISTPVQVDTGSNRQITIGASRYESEAFDFDNDGTSNLAERRDDTPLFDPRTPRNDQRDCREVIFSGSNFPQAVFVVGPSIRVEFDFAEMNANEIQNLTLSTGETLPVYLDTIVVRTPGTLIATHTAGTPVDTRLEIYRSPDPTGEFTLFSDPAGERASLSLAVEPGIYCLALFAGGASTDRELMPGTVLVQLTE